MPYECIQSLHEYHSQSHGEFWSQVISASFKVNLYSLLQIGHGFGTQTLSEYLQRKKQE